MAVISVGRRPRSSVLESTYLSGNGHFVENIPHDDADDNVVSQVEDDAFAVVFRTRRVRH